MSKIGFLDFYENSIRKSEIISVSVKTPVRLYVCSLLVIYMLGMPAWQIYSGDFEWSSILFIPLIIVIILAGAAGYYWSGKVIIMTTNGRKLRSPAMNEDKAKTLASEIKSELI